MKITPQEVKIGLILSFFVMLVSCAELRDASRGYPEEQKDLEARLGQIKLGMSVVEAEGILGGPPFHTEPTVLPSGTIEIRYYSLIYLKLRHRLQPQAAYMYRPGDPVLWMRFENGRLTSYGRR